MSPHYGSAFREDAVRYFEALTDGVCLAIDHLRAIGHDGAADDLFVRLFAPGPVGVTARETARTAPAASEEHILP